MRINIGMDDDKKLEKQLDDVIDHAGCPRPDELIVPEFEPVIPTHLLEGKDPSQKWMMERLSVIIQRSKWQTKAISDVHNYARYINGKVLELEKFRMLEVHKQASESKIKKYKKWLLIVGVLLIHPIYIQIIQSSGGWEVIMRFLQLVP